MCLSLLVIRIGEYKRFVFPWRPQDSGQAGEVGLIVKGSGAHIDELADGGAREAEHGVGAQLAETEVAEGHTAQADQVFTGLEIHDELLGFGQIADLANQPKLVSTGTTVEVVGAGPTEHGERVIAGATEGPVGGAADEEGVVAEATADAVAVPGLGTEPVIAAATGDHIAGACVDGVYTRAGEDPIFVTIADRNVHFVITGAGEDDVKSTVKAGNR